MISGHVKARRTPGLACRVARGSTPRQVQRAPAACGLRSSPRDPPTVPWSWRPLGRGSSPRIAYADVAVAARARGLLKEGLELFTARCCVRHTDLAAARTAVRVISAANTLKTSSVVRRSSRLILDVCILPSHM